MKSVKIKKGVLWGKDKRFTLSRYVEGRFKFEKSQKFVKGKMRHGDNAWARVTFIGFMLASGLCLLYFVKKGSWIISCSTVIGAILLYFIERD